MIRAAILALALSVAPAMADDAKHLRGLLNIIVAAQQCGVMPPPSVGKVIVDMAVRNDMDPMVLAKLIDEAAGVQAEKMTGEQILYLCRYASETYRRVN